MNGDFAKIQVSNLVDALVRNVNDNFKNVSFDITKAGLIKVKIILKKISEDEKEYIDDMSGEFSADQTADIVKKFIVTTNCKSSPLKYIVYNLID